MRRAWFALSAIVLFVTVVVSCKSRHPKLMWNDNEAIQTAAENAWSAVRARYEISDEKKLRERVRKLNEDIDTDKLDEAELLFATLIGVDNGGRRVQIQLDEAEPGDARLHVMDGEAPLIIHFQSDLDDDGFYGLHSGEFSLVLFEDRVQWTAR